MLVMDGYDRVKHERFYRLLGGGVEPGETPTKAVEREILEELGVRVRVTRRLGGIDNRFVYEGRPGWEIVHVFEAEFTGPVEALSVAELHLRIAWINPDEADAPLYPAGVRELLSSS